MRKTRFNVLLGATALRAVFENKAGWKVDENGAVVMQDGNPVFIDQNGQEMTLGTDTINRLNAEAKTWRERTTAAEAAVKAFEGIDAAKAREALELASRIDQKALIDAGKVDEVKAEVTKHYETQLSDLRGQLDSVTAKYDGSLLANAFKSSEWVNKNIAVPVDMLQATFASSFKVEDGKVVAYGPDGKQVYSKTRLGEMADFDEALSILVGEYPHKDRILAAPNKGGSGSGGQGGNQAAGKYVKRADFSAMAPAEQAAVAAKARAGEVQIVD